MSIKPQIIKIIISNYHYKHTHIERIFVQDVLSFFIKKHDVLHKKSLFQRIMSFKKDKMSCTKSRLYIHKNKSRQVLCSPYHLFRPRRLPSSRDDIREPPWNATGSPSIKTMYKARSSAKLMNPTETISAKTNTVRVRLAFPDMLGIMILICSV